MELFELVLNRASIYDMMFFNVKAVLEHPSLENLKLNNSALYERWNYIAETKGTTIDLTNSECANKFYLEKAIYYPEFSKIVAVTYATLYFEDGKMNRLFKKIVDNDECVVIATFMDILHELSSNGVTSSPQFFPTFCGHNIIGYDIPLLIKRFVKHNSKFENKQLPLILKKCLGAKPWESKIVDTVNVWKFNGSDYTPLMLIADYLGLKRTIELESLPEVSKYYWNNILDKPEETLKYVSLQSANQTNLVIQLMNELRTL